MRVKSMVTSLRQLDALQQAKLATVLMAVVPPLAFFYIGAVRSGRVGHGLPFYAEIIAVGCTIVIAFCGYRILSKFPRNIVKIRSHIRSAVTGVLPEKFILEQTMHSDDLLYIENNLNAMLYEMNHRLSIIKDRLAAESKLREELERKREYELKAETYPAVLRRMFRIWQKMSRLTRSLKTHLFDLSEEASSLNEMRKINVMVQEVREISIVLENFKEFSELEESPVKAKAQPQVDSMSQNDTANPVVQCQAG
ncbi:hypothetical protein [Pontiella agarivorans]|uniref:Uncharacterized protein n=1 Tax=Pontiella agarivorans TaxID=3038953 RepID=A0ABU5MWX2_9BACT|nr:hypothetical protein [Pontiella agarivorans]MDZ8118716.1 hypothetical protein [Pontiella agarivorans]